MYAPAVGREPQLVGLVEEGVLAAAGERLVHVHAGAVLALDRLGHERRVHAVAGGDRLDHHPERDQVVGGGQRVGMPEVDLVLADGDLVVGGLELEAHLLEGHLDVPAAVLAAVERSDVEVGGGVVRVDGRVAVGVELEEEELGLGADVHRVAEVGGLAQHALQVRARIARKGSAVRVGDVADQAGGAGGLGAAPGQHRVGGGVGQEVHVGLLDALEAADRRAVEHELVVERLLELVDGNRDVLDRAVRLGELQPDERDVVTPAAFDHLLLIHALLRGLDPRTGRVYRPPRRPRTPQTASVASAISCATSTMSRLRSRPGAGASPRCRSRG